MQQLGPDFESLYRGHYDFVWRCAQRLGVPPDSLDDVLQDVFVTAYRRLPDYDGRAKPSTWLFGILHNVWRNHRRGSRRVDRKHQALHQHSVARLGQLHASSERAAETELARRLLADFLMQLDDHQRSVFVLAELEGMTGPEIAEALELNLNTARSRLRAARRAFETTFEAPAELAALTESLRCDPPTASAEQRSRTHALVLAGLGPLQGVGAVGVLGLGGAKLMGAVAAVLCVVGLGLGLGAVAVGHGEGESSEAEGAAEVARIEAAPRTDGQPPAAASSSLDVPIPVHASAPAPAPRATTQRSAAEPEVTRDASLDYARLESARAALLDGGAELALEQLSNIAADGPLAWERAVTEVAALCDLDRLEAAQQVAARWNQRDAGRRIDVPCTPS